MREFQLDGGPAEYALFVDRKLVGIVEAKPAGTTLGGFAEQTATYLKSAPSNIPDAGLPLPYAYERNRGLHSGVNHSGVGGGV